jgi:hypothetical protein
VHEFWKLSARILQAGRLLSARISGELRITDFGRLAAAAALNTAGIELSLLLPRDSIARGTIGEAVRSS